MSRRYELVGHVAYKLRNSWICCIQSTNSWCSLSTRYKSAFARCVQCTHWLGTMCTGTMYALVGYDAYRYSVRIGWVRHVSVQCTHWLGTTCIGTMYALVGYDMFQFNVRIGWVRYVPVQCTHWLGTLIKFYNSLSNFNVLFIGRNPRGSADDCTGTGSGVSVLPAPSGGEAM